MLVLSHLAIQATQFRSHPFQWKVGCGEIALQYTDKYVV